MLAPYSYLEGALAQEPAALHLRHYMLVLVNHNKVVHVRLALCHPLAELVAMQPVAGHRK